jgi:hypothetical protein
LISHLIILSTQYYYNIFIFIYNIDLGYYLVLIYIMTSGYCLKCKKKNMPMKNEKEKTMKNGRKGVQGKCQKCDTNMFKITGGKNKVKGGHAALSPAPLSGGSAAPLNPAPLSGGALAPLTPTPLSGGKSRRRRRGRASKKNKSRKNRTRKSRR